MIEHADQALVARQTVIVEIPLPSHIRIARPEQVMLKLGASYHDIGAYCYAIRSEKPRSRGQPREVVLSSFLKHRPKQIIQIIKFLSQVKTDAGKSLLTIRAYIALFRQFLDWADANSFHDCLAGGQVTNNAYGAFCTDLRERFRRHEIGARVHNDGINYVREMLEAITGVDDLGRIGRTIRHNKNTNSGTEPAQPHDFAHALALNQSLFDGLCNLVLNGESFPYRLDLPKSLGWNDNFLWLFPLRVWRLPPHLWGAEREKLPHPHWVYDYEHGCLATVDELKKRYISNHPRHAALVVRLAATRARKMAQQFLDGANSDNHHWARIMLGMHAQSAFLFLFIANTGCNEAVAREIETDGHLDASTLSQNFRSIKFRAQGKPISLVTSVAFLPTLRRFMELRRWLLNEKTFPYLFFTLGHHNANPPTQIGEGAIFKAYHALQAIDPYLPSWGARKIRATVADYYQRQHDASITAKILQNSPETVLRRYNAGSPVDHHVEMSLFLEKVAETSMRQRVEQTGTDLKNAKPLEEGGRCGDYGHPEPMAEGLPVAPDCKQGQGCIFCQHRILIAGEEDARKVASAAFVMEQVILGPLHEAQLRPLIRKCDDDLEKIAAFPDCRDMVARVRKDVFENGNLTPFFADKFQLFLELGVIA